MSALRIVLTFVRIGALSELAYRASFWLQALESVVSVSTVLGYVAVVFSHTERLGGWSAWELCALIGVYFIVLGGINVVLAPSVTKLMEDVQQGTLDFTLLKPADAQLLVSVSTVEPWKAIDLLFGAGVLGYSLVELGERIGVREALAFGAAILCGASIVYAFFLMLATLAFWLVRVENILMIFWSMYTAGRWPIGIYPRPLRIALTGLVPIAFAVTVPAEAVTGRLEGETLALAALLALGLLLLARIVFRTGLRRYTGASA